MSRNPIVVVRAIGNVSLVVAIIVALTAALLQAPEVWDGWAWILLGTASVYAAASLIAHLRYPGRIAEAWDEQNIAANRDSLVFGYWTALAVFIILLALVWTDQMQDGNAIYWMGPAFALAPPLHYLVSMLRGRAE